MQLDDAFANAAHIPQADAYPPRWVALASAFRQSLGTRASVHAYGPSDRQAYDLFACDGPAKGTVIFVHGGYWLRFDRSVWSHLAQGALARGWHVAMVGYDLCPAVTIPQITDQIARAVTAIAAQTDGPLSLTGHSAGGHLVARMLAPGLLPDAVAARLTRVAPISPVADLRPLLQTSMNQKLCLDMETASAESPVLQPAPPTPVSIWVGADERPVFLEQATALSAAWGIPQVVVPGKHHFDVIDALQEPQSDIVRFLAP